MDRPLWQPSSERIARANLTAFVRDAHRQWGEDIRDYPGLYRWSVTEPERFWQSVWSFCKVIGDRGSGPVLIDGGKMPGAQWFPQARLNFAENLLRRRDHATALVFWGENRVRSRVTYGELHAEVSRLAQALRSAGVGPGDRVAGYMPNVPGTVIAMLSAASIGATWSSCSPDFGVQGVLDRFGQIEPKVLFAADGYFYNEKTIDVLERLKEMPAAAVVIVNRSLVDTFRETTARNVMFFTTVLSIFAATIAVGVVYNNARIQLAERAWELASLRVLGFTRREVSVLLLGELALEIAAAIPLGFLAGFWLAALLVRLMQPEVMEFPLVIFPATYVYAGAVVLAAGLVSALIVRNRIDNLDLVAVLKTRE